MKKNNKIIFSHYSTEELKKFTKTIERIITSRKNKYCKDILSSIKVNDILCWEKEDRKTIVIVQDVTTQEFVGKEFTFYKTANKVSNVYYSCLYRPWNDEFDSNFKKINGKLEDLEKIFQQYKNDVYDSETENKAKLYLNLKSFFD